MIFLARPSLPKQIRSAGPLPFTPAPVSSRPTTTPASPNCAAPRTRNSAASSVLPQPAPPQTSVGRPRGRPPPVISSRPWMPVGHCGKRMAGETDLEPLFFIAEIVSLVRAIQNINEGRRDGVLTYQPPNNAAEEI